MPPSPATDPDATATQKRDSSAVEMICLPKYGARLMAVVVSVFPSAMAPVVQTVAGPAIMLLLSA
jgi:hypothetical protein